MTLTFTNRVFDVMAVCCHSFVIRTLIVGLVVIFIASITYSPVYAEGSRELTNNGGSRPYIEWDTRTSAGILRKTLLRVYVNAGEIINLGSSTYGSASDPNDIIYRSPFGGQNGSCDVQNGGFGHIDTLAKEDAGPLPNPGGYIPCQVIATETGIYEIEFHGPLTTTLQNPPPTGANAPFPTGNLTYATVAAWDITVRTAGGATITGRVFTNYMAFNLGNNGFNLNSEVYIMTFDGYQYRVNLNGVDPFGFIFFSNSKGARGLSGDPLYHSVQLLGGNSVQALPSDVTIHNPGALDNPATYDYTHKIFFNTPATDLPAVASLPNGTTTWLLTAPAQPPVPTNFRFEGGEANTPGQMGTYPLNGAFKFDVTRYTSFSITLDLNQNGIFGDGNDRILTAIAYPGPNERLWDGLDAFGVPVPASRVQYNSEIRTRAGEVHFPFIDAENSIGGIIVERIVDSGTTPSAPGVFTVYYDNTYNYTGTNTYDYSLCAATGDHPPAPPNPPITPAVRRENAATPYGCFGTPPAIRTALNGMDSSTNNNGYIGNFGDERIIETWSYYPSDIINIDGSILLVEIDLGIVKTAFPNPVQRNGSVTFTLTVTNDGPSDAVGAAVQDTFPAYLYNVSWTCVSTGSASCTANGSGNINDIVNVAAGAGNYLTYTITANLDTTAPNPISNTATVSRPLDVNEPNLVNNTSTVTVPMIDVPQMTVSKDDGVTVVSSGGEPVTYIINYQNIGNADAVNVRLIDNLPAGSAFISCTGGCTGTGPVSWNAGNVPVGGSGSFSLTVNLPPVIPPSSHTNVVILSYTDVFANSFPDVSDIDIDTVDATPTASSTPIIITATGTPGTPIVITTTPNTTTLTPGITLTSNQTPSTNGPPPPTVTGTPPTATPPNFTPGTPTVDLTLTDRLTGTLTPVGNGNDPIIIKSANPAIGIPGSSVQWTITIFNPGASILAGITISDTLPEDLIYLGHLATVGQVSQSNQQITWSQITVQPGESETLVINTKIKEDTTALFIQNVAIIRFPGQTTPSRLTPSRPLEITSTGRFLIATMLPSTGEPPLWAAAVKYMGLMLVSALGFVIVGRFVRKGNEMKD